MMLNWPIRYETHQPRHAPKRNTYQYLTSSSIKRRDRGTRDNRCVRAFTARAHGFVYNDRTYWALFTPALGDDRGSGTYNKHKKNISTNWEPPSSSKSDENDVISNCGSVGKANIRKYTVNKLPQNIFFFQLTLNFFRWPSKIGWRKTAWPAVDRTWCCATVTFSLCVHDAWHNDLVLTPRVRCVAMATAVRMPANSCTLKERVCERALNVTGPRCNT